MAYCRQCGTELASESSHCPNCGMSVAEKAKVDRHISFWMLFIAAICFFFSLMMNDIAIDHIYAELGMNDVVYVSFDFIFLAYAFYFAILIFGATLTSFLTSFNALKRGICTRSYHLATLGALICSIIFLLYKIILIS